MLFSRINAVQKKAGKFDMLFCVGDFFGDDDAEWQKYSSGTAKVPIPTFILGPNATEHVRNFPDSDGGDLCENVTYLGKKGLYTGASGLTVAYLSGRESLSAAGQEKSFNFTSDIARSLRDPLLAGAGFRGVDILLTSQWPKGVEKYASVPVRISSDECGSGIIAQLALSLKPRYHFCAQQGAYYERQPYRNHKVIQQSAKHVTRFISLSKVGNPKKLKFLYAFSIMPMKTIKEADLIKQPTDCTECPFRLDASLFQQKKVRFYDGLQEEKGAQFFYDQKVLDSGEPVNQRKRGGGNGEGPQPKRAPRESPAPPPVSNGILCFSAKPKGPCWFCLGSPEVEKHLVVSVGELTYLALAKGGLVPDHLLILPIGHHQSTVDLSDDILDEIHKYKNALKKCFKQEDKEVVFFERNYKTPHLQIQVVPCSTSLVPYIHDTFMEYALSHKCELHEIPEHSDLRQIVPSGAPYFHAELPTGKRLLYRMKKVSTFPIQFGREAMAHERLLNMPHRADWRQCKYSHEEEVKMRGDMRELFRDFDFNL
ncbi:hypothetical protein CAPTEDRAFT_168674 [Capitella teleta]|uniref:Cwf19-like C-terminal domain-containing protein n=1 Tax=Capitella teleta TaxID=283909 RepID=R7URU3_CAPTE|nr:hypothetical protein CAPTEDRAFT_168674 [Capitella teleta]|eukprot:ELU06627.1 hypothetical protein CAPTEDRAFT_168674 [Capitella teleta]